MGDPVRIELKTLPALAPLYVRAALSRKGPLRKGASIPRIEAVLGAVTPDPVKLDQYRRVCGFATGGADLPTTYPMVLAGPLQLQILTSPAFPIKAMGIVHLSNLIIQHHPIPATASLAVRAWVDGHRERRGGIEFDLLTEVTVAGKMLWESVTTIMSRQPGRKDLPKAAADGPDEAAVCEKTSIWRLPEDQGRRYAAVSGDYNPIHLYPWTAKMLGGFPHPIIHGMWSLARAVAGMGDRVPVSGVRVFVEFKRPIFLPSASVFSFGPEGSGTRFTVRAIKNEKVCLTGTITREA